MRQLMIDNMRQSIGRVEDSGRYGMYFYVPGTLDNFSRRAYNRYLRSKEGKYNIDDLESLSDEDLFDAYNKFMRRYATWR